MTSAEFKELKLAVRRLKKLPRIAKSIQLLFWYRKGERTCRLLSLMKELLSSY